MIALATRDPTVATRLHEAGYTDLIPVIPPGATISAKSKIGPSQLGKVPGKKGQQGWFGFRGWQQHNASAKDAKRLTSNRTATAPSVGNKSR